MIKNIVTTNLGEYEEKLLELGFEDLKVMGWYYLNGGHKKLILKHGSFETDYIWRELNLNKTKRLSERYRLSKEGMLKYCNKNFKDDLIIDVIFLNSERKANGNCKFISKTKGEVTWNLHTIFGKAFKGKNSLFDTQRLNEVEVLNRIYTYIKEEDIVEVNYDKGYHNPTITFKFKGRIFTRDYHSLCRTWDSTNVNNYYHTEDNIITNLKERFGIENIEIIKLYNCEKSKKTRLKADIRCSDDGKIAKNVDICKMLHRGYWFSKISSGEYMLSTYMTDNNIRFETQKTFKDLKYISLLRFDFYLPDYNTCIEYDGGQHYRAIDMFGGKENFEVSQERDKMKDDYCKKKGIKLLRIPYWKLRTISNLSLYFQDIVSSN